MESHTHAFMPLLLVVGLAFAVPLTLARLKRFRLPIVVGEILAGVAVGRSGFGWVNPDDPLLKIMSELGFVFLMFLAGMEVDFTTLAVNRRKNGAKRNKSDRWGPLAIGGLSFVVTLALAGLVGLALWKSGMVKNPLMMALILSTTSLGVVVPVLKERGLSTGRYGQTLLVAALIADFATMLLITVAVALLHPEGAAARILFIGVLFAAVFALYRLGILINRIKAIQATIEELSHATGQIKMRAAFALMLMFVVLSETLGAEVILGAFMAGAIVGLLRNPQEERVMHQLEGIGFGFFIPIFFIMVGVDFNLKVLFESREALLILPILLGAAVLVKLAAALVFRLAFNWRDTMGAAALLSARLSLIIAAAAIGRELEIISDAVNAAIILVAIVTVTAAPLVFVRFAPERDEAQLRPIVVAGAGEFGLQVAEQLRGHREDVVLVDNDAERVERARQRGFRAVEAEGDRFHGELAPVLDNARAFVCTYNDSEVSHRICQYVRTQHGIDHVVSHVSDPKELHRFAKLGVTTMNPALDRTTLMVLLVRNPAAYALLSRTDDDKEVWEVEVSNRNLVGKSLRELRLPGDVLILAMRRNGELLVPHGNTRLDAGDNLTLVGSQDPILAAREMFV